MKVKNTIFAICFAAGSIMFTACGSSGVFNTVYPTLSDGRYDSEFPYRSCSQQLEEISHTVKLISVVAYYESYVFAEEKLITATDLKSPDLFSKAERVINYTDSYSGTATVIYAEGRNVALLTCAHVVNSPDTIITYYNKNGTMLPYIQSISIKVNQSNFIPEIPEKGYVEVLAIDEKNDLAVVGKTFTTVNSNFNIPVFNYPNGRAAELEWGDFVYTFGYPMNYKMISKGIVSSPDQSKGYSFLVDVIFNRGCSGGIVLAVRDGVPNFELVGLVKSVPAETEYVLKPLLKDVDVVTNPWIPYTGEFAVEKRQNIRFGIIKVIGMEAILEFFKANQRSLELKGFHIAKFFSR